MTAPPSPDHESTLEPIRNLGPVSRKWLKAAGICDRDTLLRWGPVGAFLRVESMGFRPSLNLVYALAAGLTDRDWRELSPDERHELANAVRAERQSSLLSDD